MLKKIKKFKFLFEELVSRDFKQKYKRTVLGVIWSILYPLLNLFVMNFVFKRIFGRNTPHYTTYLFCGTLIMSFFRESTRNGMNSLMANRNIITKINIPKYVFLLSNNVSSLLNFCLTLLVFFLFCVVDGISIKLNFIMLIYPILCLTLFNIGVGLVLSALYVFFRDTSYIYDIFLTLLNYLSVIFYKIDIFPENIQKLFLLNPVYCYIKYFRSVVLGNVIPSFEYHLLCLVYAVMMFLIGIWIYKKYNRKFIYHI